MTSPARAHLQRVRAAEEAAAASSGTPVEGTQHELMLAQLYEHRKALKAIQSTERKIEAKRQFVPLYDPYIDGALAAGQGGDDPLVTTMMVWNIDAGRYARAMEIAAYVLAHGLKLPDQFNRSAATLLVDEFSGAALSALSTRDDDEDIGPHLLTVLEATRASDVPDQARAKLHKAIAYRLLGKSPTHEPDYDAIAPDTARHAQQHLLRALELFDAVGVKKDLERLERRLKKAGETGAPH